MEFTLFCREVGLRLEPFQKRIVRAAAGRERELVVLIPRGSGKTTLMAAIAVHHLATRPDAEVYGWRPIVRVKSFGRSSAWTRS